MMKHVLAVAAAVLLSGPCLAHNRHTVARDGSQETFWDGNAAGTDAVEPNEWDEKGLARIGIRKDRLEVRFPQMKEQKGETTAPQVPADRAP